ncbi:hypothetical protein GPECTOR_70g481 [Gonium pectorale]|uniref:Uncharacterized protein n=1 Tax=Gonium pectorale TaxID=33097 RepID=A0A150G4L8_GONPE|nr:hypothetical protein GPECTOR_70g481 [Gonium pectorale]|eukprot:KXZ44250.1 hypothetical protein GPECTOR_70g481 [Gonium pectorale]
MPPGTVNKPKSRALKVRREKIRTKKKLSAASEKHKTQLALLKSRNPKRERKLAKRKAALERAERPEGDVMKDVVAASSKKKASKKAVADGADEMEE